MTQTEIFKIVNKATILLPQRGSYDSIVWPKVFNLIKAEKGLTLHEFVVEQKNLNIHNSLHGGFIAMLIDIGGSFAISSISLNIGLSADINITYLNGTKKGDVVKMESRVDKIGKNLAFTSVKLYKEDKDGNEILIALGRHTKFVGVIKGHVVPNKL